ncbi:hypothetical protein [Roseovarius litoreus]|uniref:hypothetical protein n=1 Tax=Roseovarius litoreus TaxID=1155722 RepID=UPI00122CF9A2|nr:hypothetical protein [Roseovarius litoreus]
MAIVQNCPLTNSCLRFASIPIFVHCDFSSDNRLVFVSNWPHREPEVAKCIKTGLTSECMISSIAPTNAGGAAVFMKLYSIVWETGSGPKKIKVREPSVIFSSQEQGFEISDTFPAIGYAFPLVECQSD